MRVAAKAAAALGAVIVLGLPALAGADSDDRLAPHRPPRPHRSAVVLLDMNDALRADRAAGGSFQIRKPYGFEYAHRFEQGLGPPLVLSIQGPALPRKRVGLEFEIRF